MRSNPQALPKEDSTVVGLLLNAPHGTMYSRNDCAWPEGRSGDIASDKGHLTGPWRQYAHAGMPPALEILRRGAERRQINGHPAALPPDALCCEGSGSAKATA